MVRRRRLWMSAVDRDVLHGRQLCRARWHLYSHGSVLHLPVGLRLAKPQTCHVQHPSRRSRLAVEPAVLRGKWQGLIQVLLPPQIDEEWSGTKAGEWISKRLGVWQRLGPFFLRIFDRHPEVW